MKMLNNSVIKDRYEVIVIGAGIGGLTTAAMLAKKGVDVLLIEQHYMPGGACGAIRRQDVTMDIGATILYGFGEKGMNTHRFVMNELEEEIDMTERDSIYHMFVGDKVITYWRDFKRFFNELLALFPNQEKELNNFYDYLYKIYDVVMDNNLLVTPSALTQSDNLKMLAKHPVGIIKLSSLMYKNAIVLFEKFFTDPELIAFFDMLTRTFSYVDSNECPAVLSATMFPDNHEGGGYYPIGSPQMLSNKLEKSIEKFGGQILYRQMVDEILISKGSAYGVRLADGIEIMADRTVYNGSIWNLYGKVVKEQHIKPKRMKWAHSFTPVHSNIIINLGLDPKGLPDRKFPMEIYIEDMYDIDGHGVTLYLPSHQEPGISPPETFSVTITCVSTLKWPSPSDPEYQSEEYKKLKERETDKILDRIEKQVPGFRKHIKFMEIGTPSTTERYTLKNWGNVGGPQQKLGQEMMKRHGAMCDWKNLYFCGDSTELALGVLPSTISGVGAANVILRDMGKTFYKERNFSRQYVNIVEPKAWTSTPDPGEPITETSAMRIAKDCQHCEKAGCINACPAGIDLVGFFRRIESGNFEGAARAIREMNPLTSICGYICPAERTCEKECYRHDFDSKPVRIRDMHKWICENVEDSKGWSDSIPSGNGKKIAVVGAGPAGLSCAHFLSRLGHQVDIMDKSDRPGGMLSHAISNFRLPEDVVKKEITGLINKEMNFQYGKSLGTDITIAELEKNYNAIFLAPGLWSGRKLDIPGIDSGKITDALSYLRKCYDNGKADTGRNVIVIGGGSTAADAAIAAKESGAEEVTLVCLENAEEMPCLNSEIEEMKDKGIKIENCWGPDKGVSESEISFKSCSSVFDDKGQFCPAFDEGNIRMLKFDQIISAVGQAIEPELAGYLEKEFGSSGFININSETMQVNNRPGVYAGGDIIRGAGTVVEAVGDGRRAAMAIDASLKQ